MDSRIAPVRGRREEFGIQFTLLHKRLASEVIEVIERVAVQLLVHMAPPPLVEAFHCGSHSEGPAFNKK
jgi:hypothetical protein